MCHTLPTKKTKSYLTQSSLTEILSKYYDVKPEVTIEGTKYKSDIQFEKDGIKYAVEFEGDSHYCDPEVMVRDTKKDILLSSKGFNCIHIPYWIQLSTYTFNMFFNFSYPENIEQTYPHGFIDRKATLPSHYCVNGLFKFNSILSELAERHTHIFVDIIKSLVYNKKCNMMDDILPIYYGSNELISLITYLRIDASKEESIIYDKFLSLPLDKIRAQCIHNSFSRH
jgi:hypothetical protein